MFFSVICAFFLTLISAKFQKSPRLRRICPQGCLARHVPQVKALPAPDRSLHWSAMIPVRLNFVKLRILSDF